ncbi:MAG TPA: OmpH family outer membrane protein [bacterium]|nr:OmpH family outer membrane protein [bacterium]
MGDIMMLGKKSINILFMFLFAVTCISLPSFAEEMKIASVDTGKILMAHPAFQKAMEKYQAEVQSMQQKISEMKEEEQMSARQMMQQQMQELGMKLETEAFNEMRKDLKRISEKQGFKYVMDSNVLLVGGHDITEDILSEIRKAEDKPKTGESESKEKK